MVLDMKTPYPLPKDRALTGDQVKERFRAHGIPISQWAKDNGYQSAFVYGVLNGQFKGHRGKAHQVAVALGMKLAPRKLAA